MGVCLEDSLWYLCGRHFRFIHRSAQTPLCQGAVPDPWPVQPHSVCSHVPYPAFFFFKGFSANSHHIVEALSAPLYYPLPFTRIQGPRGRALFPLPLLYPQPLGNDPLCSGNNCWGNKSVESSKGTKQMRCYLLIRRGLERKRKNVPN